MPRPPKSGVEYFLHDVDMRDSNSVKALRMLVGRNNALAFMCVLFEMLGQTDSFYLDCSDPYTWRVFASETDLPDPDVTKCLDMLATMGTIDSEQWTQHKVIWCPSYVDRLKIHGNRRGQRIGPPREEVQPSHPNSEVVESAFGPIELDHDWARVEESYAEQIGELPYGLFFDRLHEMYDALGAEIVILAIEYTNQKQPANMRTYLMRILENWKRQGVTTAVQARAKITEHDNRSRGQMHDEPPKDDTKVRWV